MTAEPPVDPAASDPTQSSASGARPRWQWPLSAGHRSLAFALSLAVLVAAVPTLSWVGVQLIRNSRAGHFVSGVTDPRAPGYEAAVEPTTTGLIIEKDKRGEPVGLVVVALASGGGGSSMFVPLSTQVRSPAYGVDRLSTAYGRGGEENLVGQLAGLLRMGFSDVIDIAADQWASLTAPVAPVLVDNPDAVGSGATRFAAGPIALRPDEVGDYLAATVPAESELNRVNRQQLFWQAWIRQVGASRDAAVVPGEAGSGLGLYVRTLARGTMTFESLPLRRDAKAEASGRLVVDPAALPATIARLVPLPVPPEPGGRATIRLLNGVNGRAMPPSIQRRLVVGGGSVFWIGNDRRFGRKTTAIEYREPGLRAAAMSMRAALGGRGTLRENPGNADDVDVTIIVGDDVLGPALRGADAEPPATAVAPAPSIRTPTSATTGSSRLGG